jgi:CRP/FNR family cyclic AMP-dependent transcriptional regulator
MFETTSARTNLVFGSASRNDGPISLIPSASQQSQIGSYEVPISTLHFNEGEIIFRAGEKPKGIYILKNGCVKLSSTRELTRGRMPSPEFVNKVVAPGEIFGFKGLIKNTVSPVTAKALRTTEVEMYSSEAVMNIMNGPSSILKMMLSQLLADIEKLETVGQLHYLASVQERIAYQLTLLGDKFGLETPGGLLLNLKLTRNELAQLAGTINESLSRHLTEFKTEGIIDLNGKEIIIKDREALRAKSGNFK